MRIGTPHDAPSTEAIMYRHILIPTDGSQLSELAIRQGTRLAKSIELPFDVTA
jgi:nucleotide-binding universal stress UspA family protein